jgi:hypothetical protein
MQNKSVDFAENDVPWLAVISRIGPLQVQSIKHARREPKIVFAIEHVLLALGFVPLEVVEVVEVVGHNIVPNTYHGADVSVNAVSPAW